MDALQLQALSYGLCQMACVLKERINPQFHRPGNLKGVAGFKILTELYPYKCRSKSPTSSTFCFNRLSNSNVKYLLFFKEHDFCGKNKESTSYNSKRGYFDDQVLP